MYSLGNFWALSSQEVEEGKVLVVQSLGDIIIPDILDAVPDNLLVVNLGTGGDFSEDHDHIILAAGFTGHFAQRILR